MKNSGKYELYDPNSEIVLSAESKDLMEQAMAYAVASGKDINVNQQTMTEFDPSFGISTSSDGLFLGFKMSVKRTVVRQYIMKG